MARLPIFLLQALSPVLAVLAAVIFFTLTSCGDLPRPFAGNPGATARRLAQPPPAKLVVTMPSPSLPEASANLLRHGLAEALAARDLPAVALPPQPGDWRIVISIEADGGNLALKAELLDNQGKSCGDVRSEALPVAAATADPALLMQAIQSLAPKLEDVLRVAEARLAQNDPGSLFNRPAKIYLVPVKGAPGDGNHALFVTMRSHLLSTGDLVTDDKSQADFTVAGTVTKRAIDRANDQIEIHWHVRDSHGGEAGDVAQGHDFSKGSLDLYWGEVADAVAAEAALGVHEVIGNFSGRTLLPPRAERDKAGGG